MRLLLKALVVGTFLSLHLSAEGLHIDGVRHMLDDAKLLVQEIQPKEVKGMIEREDDFFLIDIRGAEQKHHGEIYHIDSFHIPRGYLEFRVEQKIPDKKAKIVIYCCSGKRSLLAAKSMRRMGYVNVLSMAHGLKGWVEAGLPLDTVYGEMILNPN